MSLAFLSHAKIEEIQNVHELLSVAIAIRGHNAITVHL